jgi:hypothetical protein
MKHAAWNRSGRSRALALPAWQVAGILVLALALGIAIALVATSVFLIALPIAIVAVLVYRVLGAWRRRRNGGGRGGSVIEGEYEVIDDARTRPSHPRSGSRRS